ncbi:MULTISPECIES: hypothetical protein [unclassified Nocardioides]|uniref:hypothetical protein n=1 Tax=unclassified Nocardioides TaxID=2615069 RepID=UPI0007034D66|nr:MULTISPECIES: hypothetical protein [unclassified Nocardioides]KRC50144.1 hypothetical protein ASE19_16160 [Nocardioides sp. Root79]KRC75611.1 hypothetical protein ASE20_22180 [Nocardioides sp. Root240]
MQHKNLARVVLTLLACLAGSLAVIGPAAPAHAAADATISHLTQDATVRTYGQYVTLKGWVTCCGSSTPGYGANVKLQRRIGSGGWTLFSTRTLTDPNRTPVWKFVPAASASYRMYYVGTAYTKPSVSPVLTVLVRRNLGTSWNASTRVLGGKVTPAYAGRAITIQKAACSTCSWSTYKTILTTSDSRWSVRLPAYSKRTYFRAYLPPSNGYGGSLTSPVSTLAG